MQPEAHSKSKNSMIVVGVVALIVGGLVGFGITKATDNNSSDDSSMTHMSTADSDKATALRVALVTMGVNHMNYTDQAVDAALDSSPNAAAAGEALNQNGRDLGAAIGSVYGKDAETTFDKVWQLHLDDFVKYAVAGSKNDSAGKQAALADIQTNYTKPLATFIAKANPNLPEATLETSLADHIDMTAKMIDFHNAKDYTSEANELTMANSHIADLMNTLAGGIIKQYPSKF